jgi:hypothetical protein
MSFRHDRLANSAIFIRHRCIGEQHIAPSNMLHQRKGNAEKTASAELRIMSVLL